jgi:hypothetical protein
MAVATGGICSLAHELADAVIAFPDILATFCLASTWLIATISRISVNENW